MPTLIHIKEKITDIIEIPSCTSLCIFILLIVFRIFSQNRDVCFLCFCDPSITRKIIENRLV